jgi:hypothetical protein
MLNKRTIAIRIVEQSARTPQVDLNLRVTDALRAAGERQAFQQDLIAELQAFGLEIRPEEFEFSGKSTFGDVVDAVYRKLPGDNVTGHACPAEKAMPDLEASLGLADKVEEMGWRKQGLVFFLAAAALAAVLAFAWPKRPAPVSPAPPTLWNPTIVAIGLKPGSLQPPAALPACAAAALSPTGSAADPPRALFSPVWVTAIRSQSDRTWVDLALSQTDAAGLAKQLGKYDVQILTPMRPGDCPPMPGAKKDATAKTGSERRKNDSRTAGGAHKN